MKWVMKARMGLVVAYLVASVANAQSKTESNASGVVLPPDAKVEDASIGEWALMALHSPGSS